MKKGFTAFEILLVLAMLMVLFALSFPAFKFFQRKAELNTTSEEILSIIRLAQNKTLFSKSDNNWGVFFSEKEITLFKGLNYESREQEFDQTKRLSGLIEITDVNLTEGSNQVVFQRLTGRSLQTGTITLGLADHDKKRRLCIREYTIDNCQI